MKTLLLLSLLLATVVARQQGAQVSSDGASLNVIDFKWSKSRLKLERAKAEGMIPAAAMISANKNFERNRRINDPAGVRDPNLDTIDGRSAALEKSVQEARSGKDDHVEGFEYRVKVKNASAKTIDVLFWEYQFIEKAVPSNVARRQFLCGVNMKAGKEKELQAFSLAGPGDVVSAESLSSGSANLQDERVLINRIEYSDGTIWQRKDWNFREVRASVERAVSTPWGREMCRGL